MIFFYKESKSKKQKFIGGGGTGARVINFFTKNLNQ